MQSRRFLVRLSAMASKESAVIRVAVGTRDSLRSSVWRLWTHKGELYLAARSFASFSKFSFHKSGINRYAVNAEIERENSLSDRVFHKWRRGPEMYPGWTEGFGVLIPPRITQQPFRDVPIAAPDVIFVRPPAGREKVILKIIFSHKAARPEHVTQQISHAVTILGCLELDEEFAWFISFYDRFPPAEKAVIQDNFNKLKIHLQPGSTGGGMHSAFMHMFNAGIRPFVSDIELGRENLTFLAPAAIEK